MTKTTRIHDIEKLVHGNKVKTDFVAVPFTQIVNEQGQSRKIADLESNLKASFGVERIHVSSLKKLTKEFGPNGETVFEPSNKDARIRFVGGWESISNTSGTSIKTSGVFTNPNDSIEVTFYGTGLNLLGNSAASNTLVADIYVDNTLNSSLSILTPTSSILNGRNYNSNNIAPLVSGLSLGWHTVRIQGKSGNNDSLFTYGFEILNESSQITVNKGQPFQGGLSAALEAQTLFNIKPTTLTGVKGGRVLTYITEEGEIGQVVKAVDALIGTAASASHTNEDVIDTINFRHFGKNRADDFSTATATATDRAFTLNDGTTTLAGSQIRALTGTSSEPLGLGFNTTSSRLAFISVFSGLDVNLQSASTAGSFTLQCSINGGAFFDVCTEADFVSGNQTQKFKIASGLPYGTNRVTFRTNGTFTANVVVQDFITYQPKKPVIPENAIEIYDYNVMADYVPSASSALDAIATGVLRKSLAVRESTFAGSWTTPGIDPTSFVSGFNSSSTATNSYNEYSFYGTAFEWRGFATTVTATNQTITVNGSSDLSIYTTSFSQEGSGISFTDSTGVISGTSPTNQKLVVRVSGLPLGYHKIRVTSNNANSNYVDAIDVVTPIHTPNIEVGSLALADLRSDQAIEGTSGKVDLTKAKAYIVFNGITQEIYSSMNIAALIKLYAGGYQIYPSKNFKLQNMETFYGSNMVPSVSSSQAETQLSSINSNYLVVETSSSGGAKNDAGLVCVVIHGELENEENLDLEGL